MNLRNSEVVDKLIISTKYIFLYELANNVRLKEQTLKKSHKSRKSSYIERKRIKV